MGEACSIGATIVFLVAALIGVSAAHIYSWWKAARFLDGTGALLYVLNAVVYWRLSISERARENRTGCRAVCAQQLLKT